MSNSKHNVVDINTAPAAGISESVRVTVEMSRWLVDMIEDYAAQTDRDRSKAIRFLCRDALIHITPRDAEVTSTED